MDEFSVHGRVLLRKVGIATGYFTASGIFPRECAGSASHRSNRKRLPCPETIAAPWFSRGRLPPGLLQASSSRAREAPPQHPSRGAAGESGALPPPEHPPGASFGCLFRGAYGRTIFHRSPTFNLYHKVATLQVSLFAVQAARRVLWKDGR